jgi:hypothetical protein
MVKTRVEDNYFNEDGTILSSRIIIEIPLPYEMLQDCYLLYAMDAPTEIKRMLIESLGDTIDEIILGHRPKHVDEQWLRSKLKQVQLK